MLQKKSIDVYHRQRIIYQHRLCQPWFASDIVYLIGLGKCGERPS